ncbi:hypothetical protein M0R88_16820 [Halorussus gelatinilyticus]|uniref:Uncharacterized protein n=1 Tax=Halorussus gelatinilyticus TaxID=2937524 RepID=A0A8U0IGR3_9EURY|nr:hypothetical protein [Halorussus gelatinilyticus]UPW00163.1 hypothetical protein M0R88_16820 [Halorussus gelatinilyticus]
MNGFLRSLLRVRFLWLPAVGLLFAAVLVGIEWLPIGGGWGIVVAGLLTVVAVLAVGLVVLLFR